MEIYVVISEKKYFTEYYHNYEYNIKHRYVIRRYCSLCETLVESKKAARLEQMSNNIGERRCAL